VCCAPGGRLTACVRFGHPTPFVNLAAATIQQIPGAKELADPNPGVVATLAEVLKSGERAQAASLARQQCSFVLSLSALPAVMASSLARRLLVKLTTRMALALLPPAPAVWRRTRRVAALHATLGKSPAGKSSAAQAAPGFDDTVAGGSAQAADCRQQSAAEPQQSSNDPASSQPQQADVSEDSTPVMHIPDEVEDIAGELLQALRDPDTIVRFEHVTPMCASFACRDDPCWPSCKQVMLSVRCGVLHDTGDGPCRWSAARGVGRVSARLPAAAGAEVLDSVLQVWP
jgi:hypothetical protein